MTYFMRFQVVGEVAEMLLLENPERRLLVDISTDANTGDHGTGRRYENRTSFSIRCPLLIDVFRCEVSVGDVIQAAGTFSQTDYVPHKTSYIDTTFLMQDFSKFHQETARFRESHSVHSGYPSTFLH
ncbi:hypothetical protein [Shimia thalassica]|uniref:hypothetical protein n=1 Tax=Shimia thalassica TaxID=1715693 RepID=UPI0024940A0D|nr:hypothetical protein [Shimia thalassica]